MHETHDSETRLSEHPATGPRLGIIGDWNTPDALFQLASQVDVITLENEFVDASLLAGLEQAGHSVWPTSCTLALVQDKFIQKQALQSATQSYKQA